MDLGKAIESLRLQRGWTKKELAIHSGIDQGNLNRIISGKQQPTIQRLTAIAEAFDLQTYELMRLAERRQGADARKALLYRLIDEMTDDQIEYAFRRSSNN